MLRPGKYIDGKVVVEDHPVGSVLSIGKDRYLVNTAGAIFPYEEPARKTEQVVGGTKVPKPPKV